MGSLTGAHSLIERAQYFPLPETLTRLSGLIAFVMISALVVGHVGAQTLPDAHHFLWIAAIAACLLALLRLGSVQPLARIFVGLALILAAIVATAMPDALPRMEQALMQGTAFSAFLTSLGLIRGPVRASKTVARAAARLFAFPARLQTAAMTYGAQALSILFNIGTIGMISDIARNHAEEDKKQGRPPLDADAMTLCALRGTIMMTVWNPIGVGFAIVTTAIPTIEPVPFLALSFVCALLTSGIALVWLQQNSTTASGQPLSHEDQTEGQSGGQSSGQSGGKALVFILAAVAGLIAVTLFLHHLLDISFIVAACIVMPVLSLIWPLLEPAAKGAQATSPIASLGEASDSMANEATIFLAASVIGAGISVWLGQLGLSALLASGLLPAIAIILACLFLVPLAGALLIPHSILVVLAAQLFGTGIIGQSHPYALALGLCFAWAMAISASPISAMSIITARQLGVSTSRVTFAINRSFTFVGLATAAALITLTYIVE